MRVLVACEFSGVVREAFRALGHETWSCDILPAEDGSPFHIQDDVLGHTRVVGEFAWDLMIAHPPCTYLCNSGVRWLSTERGRKRKMQSASRFFKALWECRIPKICVENPIPHKYGRLPPYTQIIQPWMFGHGETKATCLWLKGLQPLVPTRIVKGREGRIHLMSPGPDRGKERSRTYPGIAKAMAKQWSGA